MKVSCLQEALSIVEKIKHSKVLPVVRSGEEEQFVWEDKTHKVEAWKCLP